jgi:asparagine synthase (glutamine-hydrolysing)
MCGIAGSYDLAQATPAGRLREIIKAMTATLVHRGPDEQGIWLDEPAGIALGHRRLSIVDLSPGGSQPMQSPDGRHVLTFNGEIYNHRELRRDLIAAGETFRGQSDTEVLLAAVNRWGIAPALVRLNGMFAFAVWDSRERTLTLARDRLGIKPLYYGWLGQQFVFASELKALRQHPEFRGDIDRQALAAFLQHSYIPTPRSIYHGIAKLPPGCILEVTPGSNAAATPVSYWSLREIIGTGKLHPFNGTEAEATDQLEALLRDSIAMQRLADVPVGASLSGGIDSSLVVALMQAEGQGSVRTFTIGFESPEDDESRFAAPVARHLGIEPTIEIVTAADAIRVIPQLPAMYDEPFADASQIPTHLVSRLARREVTVCLSGDGGDELFGGYDRYARIDRIWRRIGWLPVGLRRPAGRLYQELIHRRFAGRSSPSSRARALMTLDERALYEALHCHWPAEEGIVIGGQWNGEDTPWRDDGFPGVTGVEAMMALDTQTYLPDCILTKLDRASMAVSLEARVPLLDHRIVEFAWRLPFLYKCHRSRSGNGQTKLPLRRVLERHVRQALFERPKRGFGVPIGDWLLSERRLADEGFLRPPAIRQKWNEHLSGRANWQYLLWDVLMFEAWVDSVA